MNNQTHRPVHPSWPGADGVDRSKTIDFTFDGKRYEGHAGDTLASALLANGVHLVGRSFKYHRPRGVMTAGSEEPNALIQLGDGAKTEPNLRATQIELFDGLVASSQNRWPSLRFDIGAINNLLSRYFPAGFYYKTFMWPPSFWMKYECFIRRAAGLGKAPEAAGSGPLQQDLRPLRCAGGGGRSRGPCCRTRRRARRRAGHPGGRAVGARRLAAGEQRADRGQVSESTGWPRHWPNSGRMPDVKLLSRTNAFGYYDHNYLTLMEQVTSHLASPAAHLPCQRLWRVRAKQVVLATGAVERPLVFDGNERAGVMLANAVFPPMSAAMACCPAGAPVLLTNNDSAYRAALDLAEAGATVAAIVDLQPEVVGPAVDAARAKGIEVLANHAITGTSGKLRVDGVTVMQLARGGVFGDPRALSCDLVLHSGGWTPSVASRQPVARQAEMG